MTFLRNGKKEKISDVITNLKLILSYGPIFLKNHLFTIYFIHFLVIYETISISNYVMG